MACADPPGWPARVLSLPLVVPLCLVAAFAWQCDDPAPSESGPSPAKKRTEDLERRVDEFADENAETLRSHRPDVQLEFEERDAGD